MTFQRAVGLIPLSAVLVASLSMALFWCAMVPIFQSPDEPAHFQYAHALATAKHILRGRDRFPGFDPEIGTLMSVVDTKRIAFHPTESVPATYGTPEFFRSADRLARSLPSGYFDRPTHPVPDLVYTYPVGGYAIIATSIAVLQDVFHVGIVEQIFGARVFCCLLFSFGLCFWYLSFRAMRLRSIAALGLTVIVGLFPLSSFVASYVQPDNVVFALIAPILWCSLRLRDGDDRLAVIGAFGFAFGLLLITKFHYALCIAITTFPIALIHLGGRLRHNAKGTILRVAVIIVPAAAALAVHAYVSAGAPQAYFSGNTSLFAGLSKAYAGGAGSLLRYVIGQASASYYNYYLRGTTISTYWATFGWVDTKVTFFNKQMTAAVWLVIEVWTNVTVLLTVILVVKNLRRILRIAAKRSVQAAIVLLVRDPIFNVYLTFTLFMFALFIVSSNEFSAQGRNWYPLEGSAFATCIVYAPRVFRAGMLRRVVSGLGIAFLVAYCTVGSACCIRSVLDRYYHPMPPTVVEHSSKKSPLVRYAIESASSQGRPLSAKRINVLPLGSVVTIRGWSLDAQLVADEGIFATLDGAFGQWAREEDRPDIAHAFDDPDLRASGFAVTLVCPARRGVHVITLEMISTIPAFGYKAAATYRILLR